MDPLDRYLDLLASTASQFLDEGRTAMDIMQRDMTTTAVPELVGLRVQFLTDDDHDRAGGLLATGCFSEMTGDERLAAFVVCYELDDEISKLDVVRRFAAYGSDQPLFTLSPALWSEVRASALVATAKTRHLRRSSLVEIPGGWGRLDPFLPPELLRWVEDAFPGLPTFIRLDPWFSATERPPERLYEAAVRPARPGWWRNLALRSRDSDGAHYVLQATEADLPEKVDEFWEHRIRGVQSLEVHAQRPKADYLSMMIEELTDDRRPDGRLIGRCIHLDTDAPFGTNAEAAVVQHLDLAINMYFDDAAARRREQSLSNGRVEDASVRTHLLRIERAPFAASVEFARQFFQSSVLVSEWLRDQFASTGSSP